MICQKIAEHIGVFWRRDSSLVLKCTRGRIVTENSKNIVVFGEYRRSGVETYKRKTVIENSENIGVFGKETLVL